MIIFMYLFLLQRTTSSDWNATATDRMHRFILNWNIAIACCSDWFHKYDIHAFWFSEKSNFQQKCSLYSDERSQWHLGLLLCLSEHIFIKIYRDFNFFLIRCLSHPRVVQLSSETLLVTAIYNLFYSNMCNTGGRNRIGKNLKSLYILTKKCPCRHKHLDYWFSLYKYAYKYDLGLILLNLVVTRVWAMNNNKKKRKKSNPVAWNWNICIKLK